MRAMILAAGLGTRMAPLTRLVPKPALPVLGEPMLAGLVRSLAQQGVERVVVNTHAFPAQLEASLRGSPVPVQFSQEPTLLGSAGGLFAAREHLLGREPIVVLNADMRLDLDLAALRREHERSGALATLLLRDDARKERFGTIGYTAAKTVCRITQRIRVDTESGCGLFTGVQMIDSSIFEYFPPGGVAQLMPDVYVPMLRAGRRLAVALQPDSDAWWPIGDPGELLDANLRALRETVGSDVHVDPGARVEGKLVGPVWIDAGAEVPASATVGPDAVLGAGAVVPDACRVRAALFLSDARPAACDRIERAIAFDREVWRDA